MSKKVVQKLQLVIDVEVCADSKSIAKSAIADAKREIGYRAYVCGQFGKSFGDYEIKTGRVRELKL